MKPLRRIPLLVTVFLLLAGSASAAPTPNPETHPFEILPGSFHVTPSTTLAGSHPDLTTTLDFAHDAKGRTYDDVLSTIVDLPVGLIGSDTALPTCTNSQLFAGATIVFGEKEPRCPPGSVVGLISFDFGPSRLTAPLYNMETTSPGIAAQLGFLVDTTIQKLDIYLRPGDSGISVVAPKIENLGEPRDISVTVWGVPASHAHDLERERWSSISPGQGQSTTTYCGHPVPHFQPVCNSEPLAVPAGIPSRPYLSDPTGCGPHLATLKADSWEHPDRWSEAQAEFGPVTDCESVPFQPSVEAHTTTEAAESATGLNFAMNVPQTWDNPFVTATSHLKKATVTLPQGMSLNPSAGSGLGYCTEAQLATMTWDSTPGLVGCPEDSKVGSVEVETPVLFEKAEGAVYVAQPFHNPFNSLLALYIVARVPERGIIVKVAGEVHADPVTGQLTTTFDENPQVPFSKFTLHFRQGATSPLVTPPTCGEYPVESALTPWARPLEAVSLPSSISVLSGVDGGPCPSGGTPPFHPGLIAGSLNNAAGSYSPFYIRLSREDGEQEITHFSIKLPPGVTGKLAGVARCSDAQIAQAKSREHEQGGAEEEADPSCPPASQVGRTIVEAGVGSILAQAPGKVYLAGPYHGAPISVVAITAARVGPFDLGTVVVREALRVDPETAEVSVDPTGSDPLPHIIDGIPTHLRNIRIYMDRPEFVLNPTSCEPTSTASTVTGSGRDFASESDDQPLTVTSPFQAADCQALGFKPRLRLELKGRKTRRGGLPALKATLTARPGDANIGRAQVTLPPSEFLEQGHLKDVCPRSVWIQGQVPGERCPASSIYGHARAITPLLEAPLEGPVYLRTGYGTRLPEMVAALNGEEINVDVVGEIDSVHKKGSEVSLLRNTFKTVPDAPVSRFELELKGGRKGLLVNSTNVCKGTHKALAAFTGHNGKLDELHPKLLAPSCGRHGGHTHQGHRRKSGHAKKGK